MQENEALPDDQPDQTVGPTGIIDGDEVVEVQKDEDYLDDYDYDNPAEEE